MQQVIGISEFIIIYIFLQKAIQQRMLGKSLTHDEESEELNANQPETTTEVSTD